jgi:multiple sugar transport system substrate-binding protein
MSGHSDSRRVSRRWFLGSTISAGAAAGVGVLAACSAPAPAQPAGPAAATGGGAQQSAPATTGTITLTIMGSPTNVTDAMTKLWSTVEQKNKIKINYVESPQVSQTYHDKLVTMFSAKDSSVDIFNCNGTVWPPEFAAAGWMLPLDKYFSDADMQDHMPAYRQAFSYKGALYGIAHLYDVGMLYYRKDLLDAAHLQPPTTWDELITQSKQLGANDQLVGHAASWSKGEQVVCRLVEFIYGNGGQILDDNQAIKIDSPEAVEGLQRMVDLVQKDKVTPLAATTWETGDARQIFTEGKAIFTINWNFVWAQAQATGSKVIGDVGVALVPKLKAAKSAATLGGWGWGINAASKNVDAAVAAIKTLTAPEQMKLMFVEGGVVPTRVSLFKDPEFTKQYPHAQVMLDIIDSAVARPRHPRYREISEIIQTESLTAINGQKSPKQAVSDIASQIQPLLA